MAMRRRELLLALTGFAAWSLRAVAQAPVKVHRIGLLGTGAPPNTTSPLGVALVRGFAQHGYELGKNLELESRGAEQHMDRLPKLVAELVASKVDAIIAIGYPCALAAKQGTTLPVVAAAVGDPVKTGLAKSLARPGGNVTGVSDVSAEVTPKRLDLLKQLAPNMRRVAVLWNAQDLGMTMRYEASEAGAKVLGIAVEPLGVQEPDRFEDAFDAMNREMPDAILMVSDSLTSLNRKKVFAFALEHRLPAIYEFSSLVRDGGLMSYGPDFDETFARVADLVDRIFKGASPSELPFEQPTLFRFVINLKTAKTIGLQVPAALLATADEVIE